MTDTMEYLKKVLSKGISSIVVVRASDMRYAIKAIQFYLDSEGTKHYDWFEDNRYCSSINNPLGKSDELMEQNIDYSTLEANPSSTSEITEDISFCFDAAEKMNNLGGFIYDVYKNLWNINENHKIVICGFAKEFGISWTDMQRLQSIEEQFKGKTKILIVLDEDKLKKDECYGDTKEKLDYLEEFIPVIKTGNPDASFLEWLLSNLLAKKNIELSTYEKSIIVKRALGGSVTEVNRLFRIILGQISNDPDYDINLLTNEMELRKYADILPNALEYLPIKSDDSILGGLDAYKEWVENVKSYHAEADTFGIHAPKGVLLVGPPGTGKSHAGRYLAAYLKVPLLKMHVEEMMSKYVSEGERVADKTFKSIDTLGVCIILIDEIEKTFANTRSGDTAHESSKRLEGQFLTWLSDRTSKAIVVATSNSLLELPLELRRSGRFDKVFYVGLPDLASRMEIFRCYLKIFNKKLSKKTIQRFAELTDGFSGAEIEAAIQDAMRIALKRDKILKIRDIEASISHILPLSCNSIEDLSEICMQGMKIGTPAGSLSNFEKMLLHHSDAGYSTSIDDWDPAYY